MVFSFGSKRSREATQVENDKALLPPSDTTLTSTTKTTTQYGAIHGSNDNAEDDDEPVELGQLKKRATVPPPRGHSLWGIFLITLGSFSFSCMFLLVKLMQGTANSFTLVFYRSFVQIILSYYPIWQTGEPVLGHATVRGWLLVRGGIGSAAVICFFYAIQHLALPDAVTLQFTTPPFAAAFAVCLAGERWLLLDMVGAVVCLMGVVLIAHPSWIFGDNDGDDDDKSTGNGQAIAIAVALLGAALAGLAYMSVRNIGSRASANVMVLYYGVLSIPMVLIGSKFLLGTWTVWGDVDMLSTTNVVVLLLTGLAGYGGQLFTNLGLQRETAATGTLATCTQIVWTYIFEMAFLHEPINAWSVTGTFLILSFMVFVGVMKMKVQPVAGVHESVGGEPEAAALLYSTSRRTVSQDVQQALQSDD